MNKRCLLSLGTIALLVGTVFASAVYGKDATPFRILPLPKEEHGYSNFESIVITSQRELDAFLQKSSRQQDMGWNNRAEFEKALAEAELDFSRESLVLIRHTEGSGSVQVTFRRPKVENQRVVCQIDRKVPAMGTADMAYYCFALAVDRASVTEVEVKVSGREPTLLTIGKPQRANKKDAGDGN